jgi:hypothetical protein
MKNRLNKNDFLVLTQGATLYTPWRCPHYYSINKNKMDRPVAGRSISLKKVFNWHIGGFAYHAKHMDGWHFVHRRVGRLQFAPARAK